MREQLRASKGIKHGAAPLLDRPDPPKQGVRFDNSTKYTARRRKHKYKESDTKHHQPWITVRKGTQRALATKEHRVAPVKTTKGQYGILDSGTTSHFVPDTFVGTNPGPPRAGGGPPAGCPSGAAMPAAGAGELSFPALPADAKKCSKLKGLQVPLASVKQLCARGMIAIFCGSAARAFGKSGHMPTWPKPCGYARVC